MTLHDLSNVPKNVLLQILQLIEDAHPSTLYNLLFLKPIKPTAEILIYRRVTITGPGPFGSSDKHWPTHQSLLKRILDPRDHLRSLIRELSIQQWPGPESPDFGVDVLENLLERIKNLFIFKWESQALIPPSVLAKFHTLFPDSFLEMKNRRRAYNYGTLDLDLLRSPQLRSVDLAVLQTSYGLNHQISEFPVLKQILQHSLNLRVLYLGYYWQDRYELATQRQKWKLEHDLDGAGPLNLPFQNKDSFPTLVELGILKQAFIGREEGYDFSMPNCIAWKKAMNWKALKKLDLGNATPTDFFRVFRGHIPQLKVLKFRLKLGPQGNDPAAPILIATQRFLDSVTGLEELIIQDWTRAFFVDICPSIQRHAQTLRILEVNPSVISNSNAASWASEDLTRLIEGIPRLDTLALAVDLSTSTRFWDSRRPSTWPEKPFSTLCRFSNIESLQMRIRWPEAGHRPRDIDKEAVSKLATDLFKGFFAENIKSRLTTLDLQVQRDETSFFDGGTVGVTVVVKRSVRDDASQPPAGGFHVKTCREFDGF